MRNPRKAFRLRITGPAVLAAALLGAPSGMLAEGITAEPLPIGYFTRDDITGQLKVSPDGRYLALSTGQIGESGLLFLDATTKAVLGGVRANRGMEIDDFHWISPRRVIYQIAERQPGERFTVPTGEIFAIDIDGKKNVMLYGYRAGEFSTGTNLRRRSDSRATPTLLSTLDADERHILIAEQPWRQVGNRWYLNRDAAPVIIRLDVFQGRGTSLGTAPLANAVLLVDRQDQVRFALGFDRDGTIKVNWRREPGGPWEEFSLPGFRSESIVPRRFTQDNAAVLFTGVPKGESLSSLFRLELESQAVTRLFSHAEADVSQLVNDFRGDAAVGVHVHADRPEIHLFETDHPAARLHAMLQRAFAGHAIHVTSTTRDGRKAIVWVGSDVNPGDYYLFDSETMNAELIRPSRHWVDPELMQPKEAIRFAARDGMELRGYLTRPRNGIAPYPLIVLPHGGPHGVRDTWYFDWEAQLFASRGYAVLQVNFRGSAGYGMDFATAGHGEWGGLMQDDITDATHWAVEEGLAAEGRVCIVGSSYGGYAALMGVMREPGLYRCAVGQAGVYDLELLYSTGDIRHSRLGLQYLENVLGRDGSALRARSPVHQAAQVQVPVMLIHGSEDGRADYQHSQRMRRALDAQQKPYEWIALRGEGHGIADEASRAETYGRILEFLASHLGHPEQGR
jgi:dipeptidyl aminopeptidase/acylaminoacyl peptidase